MGNCDLSRPDGFPSLLLDPDYLFRSIPTANPVLLAVSGGSDSLALLHLANIWAQKHDVMLQAVTVDHGLRPEAAAEAAFVAGVCASLGVSHVTLAWDGIKPSFGIQEAARLSRYSLMDDFAHEIGAEVIMTGHTCDDQTETVMMRMFRHNNDSDGRGLSGMDRLTWLYGGTKLFRPLLGTGREKLRQYLSDRGQSWIEDPSNLDTSYERVRIRQWLEENPDKAGRVEKLSATSGRLRSALARDVGTFLTTHASVLPGPVFRLDASLVADNPVCSHAVQMLIAMAGGQLHLVARHRLQKVFALNNDPAEKSARRITLGGACIELKNDRLIFYREARNQSSLLLEPGEAAIWDGRMHAYNGTAMPVFIEVASRQQIREFEDLRGKPYPVRPRAALRSTPILHVQQAEGGTEPILPLVEASQLPRGLNIRLASPGIEHFCPEHDAPLREWVRSLDQYPAASLQP